MDLCKFHMSLISLLLSLTVNSMNSERERDDENEFFRGPTTLPNQFVSLSVSREQISTRRCFYVENPFAFVASSFLKLATIFIFFLMN